MDNHAKSLLLTSTTEEEYVQPRWHKKIENVSAYVMQMKLGSVHGVNYRNESASGEHRLSFEGAHVG